MINPAQVKQLLRSFWGCGRTEILVNTARTLLSGGTCTAPVLRCRVQRCTGLTWVVQCLIRVSLCLAGISLLPGHADADEGANLPPREFRSKNFVMRTDLPERDAQQLLDKMETMLRIVSGYWGAPSRKTIECCVVSNADTWPAELLPAPVRPHVQNGGLTVAQGVRIGRQMNVSAVSYASSRFGTPQHEAVHAYCYQTFGSTGPTWYAEGMAEMGNYWVENNSGVNTPDYVIDFLRNSDRPSIDEITSLDQASGDGWRNYAWRWALCHFMVNNSNYSDRFRTYGISLLNGKRQTFGSAFDSQRKELEFEFGFFLDHLQSGFDCRRCSWDWKSRFRTPRTDRPLSATIKADRGWQPAVLRMVPGQKYRIEWDGTWNTNSTQSRPDSSPKSPDQPSTEESPGQQLLKGCVMLQGQKLQLSEPFEVHSGKSFAGEFAGDLYLRCPDSWDSLEGNSGTVRLQISAEN